MVIGFLWRNTLELHLSIIIRGDFLKKLYILICILLCCGCSAKYEIDFKDNNISDKLSITYSKNDEIIRSFAPDPLFALDNIPYDLETKDNGDSIDLKYSYTFTTSEYSNAFIPASCFTSFNFVNENDMYYFIADGEFLCSHIANKYFDSLDIVISTNHLVVQNNADEIKNGKYIWHVNPDEEISLRFIVSSKVANTSSTTFWGIFSIVGMFVIVIGKIIINRKEK